MKKKTAGKLNWDDLIHAAEAKISQNRRKIGQLEALVISMKAQKAAGEPTPSDICDLRMDLSSLLQ